MSEQYLIQGTSLANLANAVRSKNGSTDQMSVADMFTAVNNIKTPTEPYVEETYDEHGDLTSAVLHGQTIVRAGMFRTCESLTSVILPTNVTDIKSKAFMECMMLESIDFPSTLTYIGDSAFEGCINFNVANLPSGLTTINSRAFYACHSLALTSLPDEIGIIFNEAFYNCSSLALTGVPDLVSYIGDKAFYGCTGLTSFTFKGRIEIAADAFEGCTNLATINVPWAEGDVENAPWGATNATINYNYTH